MYGAIVEDDSNGGNPTTESLKSAKTNEPVQIQGRKLPAAILLLGLTALFLLVSISGQRSKSFAIQLLLQQQDGEHLLAQNKKEITPSLPNIILYLIDDQGFADMGYQGQDFKELTPNLDLFAEDGIKLTKYYTEYVCTPARAALMTGKVAVQTGMQYSVPDMIEPWGVPTQYKFLSDYLQGAGYKTHLVGKWHLGFAEPDYTPLHRGFDSFFGFMYGKGDYYSHSMPRSGSDWSDFHYNKETYPDAIGVYSSELFEDRVTEVISDHDKSNPLFLYYSQQLMHSPVSEPPDEYFSDEDLDLLDGLVSRNRKITGKMSLVMDHAFQKMVEDLKNAGLYDNSYIIVASDNGGCAYDGTMNSPLRGEKNTVFEGGVRVNAFIHSPLLSQTKRGSTYDNLFHVSDWFKTILVGIVGLEEESVEQGNGYSINQWDYIIKPDRLLLESDSDGLSGPRTEVFHNIETKDSGDIRGAVRIGNYKLIYGERDADWYTPANPPRLNYCELVEETSTITWVFDINDDPYETNNIVDTVDEYILDELWTSFDRWYLQQVPSAYKDADESCYKTWKRYDYFMVPWINVA